MPAPTMKAPKSGVTVRMYRIGHGDCFLLAFRGKNKEPIFVLIDCGTMPGSKLDHDPDEVIEDIYAATGGRLHVVVITHEHADHVSGFAKKKNGKALFSGFKIDRLWLAWTEDPDDDDANKLRTKYKDVLLRLFGAQRRLALGQHTESLERADRMARLLDLELGVAVDDLAAGEDATPDAGVVQQLHDQLAADDGDEVGPLFSAFAARRKKIKGITNKRAIQLIRKTAKKTSYLEPRKRPYTLPSVKGAKVFVLGPPRDAKSLRSMDPEQGEGYSRGQGHGAVHSLAARGQFVLGSLDADRDLGQPFPPRYRLPKDDARQEEFFQEHYFESDQGDAWRRIDHDWLGGAEALALRINHYTNNGSLVLAFELPKSKRVLLFTGDAQRGNWVSWSAEDKTWTGSGGPVTARDLLARTVFYKVGHHGSHNATLKGRATSPHPNVSWMAQGAYRDDFTAMIPAHEAWALSANNPPWTHPLPSIERALRRRADGRVVRADDQGDGSNAPPLYFEHTVFDKP